MKKQFGDEDKEQPCTHSVRAEMGRDGEALQPPACAPCRAIGHSPVCGRSASGQCDWCRIHLGHRTTTCMPVASQSGEVRHLASPDLA